MGSTGTPSLQRPSQGEICVIKLPTEPPDKGLRYVIVISSNAQNHHPRSTTVVVVPMGTTIHREPCVLLTPGQTGLAEASEVWANGVTTVSKKDLRAPRSPLRTLSRSTVVKILRCVVRAMGVLPSELAD
jgi:mRNA-degrading endonuclease toxin of MazEF toxin-antitoxin module